MAIWSLRSGLRKWCWKRRAECVILSPACPWHSLGLESGYMGNVVQAWSCLLATAYDRNDFQYSKSHSMPVLTAPFPFPAFSPWGGPGSHTSEELAVGKECSSCVYSQKREIRQKHSPWLGGGGPSVPVHVLLGSRMKTSMSSAWGFATAWEALICLGAEGQTQV